MGIGRNEFAITQGIMMTAFNGKRWRRVGLLAQTTALLIACLLHRPLDATEFGKVENVILVTLDGLRFQELFEGADRRLINKEDGMVDKPEVTLEKYWVDDKIERRRRLMPFFWSVVAEQGQVFGSPDHDSTVLVENGRYFSYPGYNEILTGFADKSIDSNDKKPNKNVTVLEWFNRQPNFKGKVAAFCSWDVFPFIINEDRSGVPVNAGWKTLDEFENPQTKVAYQTLAKQLPMYWRSVRYDAFTFRGAFEYMKSKRPRLLYVALGETDDWAHVGRYDLYLDMATMNDQFIRELWEQAQSMDQYRDKTALVITTDHGRGDGREGWKNHSDELAGSERIWIAVMGPGVDSLGVRERVHGTQGQTASTVAALLGKSMKDWNPAATRPLPLAK